MPPEPAGWGQEVIGERANIGGRTRIEGAASDRLSQPIATDQKELSKWTVTLVDPDRCGDSLGYGSTSSLGRIHLRRHRGVFGYRRRHRPGARITRLRPDGRGAPGG